MTDIEVLIVGAGPTGLMMATELTRYGISFRIVDKNSGPCKESRAAGIQARTVEIFDHLGIVCPFLEEGLAVHTVNPMNRGRAIGQISFCYLDSPYPFVLCLEQSQTEKILSQHLRSLEVLIERETELISLKQSSEGVEAILLHLSSGKKETVRAKWVAGCDGSRSFVRKMMHLSFLGKTFSDIFSLADIQINWKYPHDELFAFPDPEGVAVAFPLPGKGRYRLIFQLERCRGLLSKKRAVTSEEITAIPLPTIEEITRILRRYANTELEVSHPQWITHFNINSRMTSSYREGRFFLLGDAAHIHSPVGAQGMNTGLQDAFNLAWKLAFVLRKKTSESLLDSYHLERHGFGKALLKWTERASRMLSLHNPWIVHLRNWCMGLALRHPFIQKKVVRVVSQIAIRYPRSTLIQEGKALSGGPYAGERVPNVKLIEKQKQTDLYTLLRNPTSFVLLLFMQKEMSPSVLRAFGQLLKFPVIVFLIVQTEKPIEEDVVGINVLSDCMGQAFLKFGVRKEGVYILRPDLYVGYRNGFFDLQAIRKYLQFHNL